MIKEACQLEQGFKGGGCSNSDDTKKIIESSKTCLFLRSKQIQFSHSTKNFFSRLSLSTALTDCITAELRDPQVIQLPLLFEIQPKLNPWLYH